MTIETKFNIGDKVYVLYNGFIRVAFIIKIIVLQESSLCNIQYRVQVKDQDPNNGKLQKVISRTMANATQFG